MNRDQPSRPANFAHIVAINQGRRPVPLLEPAPEPLPPARVAELVDGGHLVLDVRSPDGFGESHVPGACNVQLASPEFEQRVGWVLPQTSDAPVILVVEAPDDARRAMELLAFVGLDRRVAGYLDGGMEAWREAGRRSASIPQVDVRRLYELAGDGACILDVRELAEWNAGHIDAARQLSYKFLRERQDELRFPDDEPIFVVCAGGWRSSTACSILRERGLSDVRNVSGGMSAWTKAGLPTVV